MVDPKTFPNPPSSPVVVTEPPKYGDLKENPNGTYTYVPDPPTSNNPVLDEVAFQYTDLSGATIVVRKQFILIEEGDVPSIIQTGYGSTSTDNLFGWLTLLAFISTAVFLLGRFGKGKHNA